MKMRDLSPRRLVQYPRTWCFDVGRYGFDKFRRIALAAGENVVCVVLRAEDERVNMHDAEFDVYRVQGVLPGDAWCYSTGIFVTAAAPTTKPSMARMSRQRLHWSPADMQTPQATLSHRSKVTD